MDGYHQGMVVFCELDQHHPQQRARGEIEGPGRLIFNHPAQIFNDLEYQYAPSVGSVERATHHATERPFAAPRASQPSD